MAPTFSGGINVLGSIDGASRFWEWLTHRPSGYVSCDIETGSNPPGHETDWARPGFHIRMVQFGDRDGGWAIPMDGWPALVKQAFEWCSRNRIKTVWWNGFTFDTQALLVTHGIVVDPIHLQDMQVYSRLRGYGDELHGLKDQGIKELGSWVGIGESALDRARKANKWTWSEIPWGWHGYPMYGVIDTIADALLYEKWEKDRIRWSSHHDLEIAVAQSTNEMARTGAAVDGTWVHKQLDEFTGRERDLLQQGKDRGWGDITVGANVEKILRDAGALNLSHLTGTGKISMDEKQLVNSPHPLAKLLLKYRKTQLVRSRYFQKLSDLIGGTDGIGTIHPSIWSMQAKTGRMSVSNPPLQQMPADDVYGPLVRNSFVPRSPDEVLVGADYGQIEMRLWASMNDDKALLAVFAEADATGTDFFTIMGRQMYHDPAFQKSDKRRGVIKSGAYGLAYTAGDPTISETTGVPLEELQPVTRDLRTTFPSFDDLGQKLVQQGDGGLYIETRTGRRFRCKNKKNGRILPNWGDQGHAAEIMKEGIIRMRAAGLGPYMVLPVHDEVVMSVPRNMAREVAHEMETIMGGVVDPEEYGVPIKASSYIADRWGESEK
jgi:DNA polymerase-1